MTTTDPLAPFRAAASPEQRAAYPGPPVICKRCNTPRRGGCLCGRDGDELAWLPGDRGYPTPAPPEMLARLLANGLVDLTAERLDELDRRAREAQERASKATSGPWEAAHCRVFTTGHVAVARQEDGRLTDVLIAYGSKEEREANASLAAHAREDVPVLAAAVLALSAEVRRLRGQEARASLMLAEAKSALRGVAESQERTIARATEMLATMGIALPQRVPGEPQRPIGEMAVDSGKEEA